MKKRSNNKVDKGQKMHIINSEKCGIFQQFQQINPGVMTTNSLPILYFAARALELFQETGPTATGTHLSANRTIQSHSGFQMCANFSDREGISQIRLL